ncbi:MAG: oligosaccharide repeat unit polymerase [Prevotella sp.]|nr:oligosaccharide repeat unit polymerase [Prevotella sp.]
MKRTVKMSGMILLLTFIVFIAIYSFGQIIGYNAVVFIIIFAAYFIVLYLTCRIDGLLESPLVWWEVFWLLFIIIARFKSDNVEITFWISDLFWYVMVNTVVFFCTYMFFRSNRNSKVSTADSNNTGSCYLFTWFIIAILIIGIIGFILQVREKGYIPLLSGNLGASIRRNFEDSQFGSIFNVARIGCAYVPLLKKKGASRFESGLAQVCFVLYLLCSLLSGWRFNFFQAIVLYVTTVFLVSSGEKIKKGLANPLIKKAIKYFLVLLVVFVGVALVRLGVAGSLKGTVSFIFNYIYMYISPQFINFGNAMKTLTPNGNFTHITEGIWSIFIDGSRLSSYNPVEFSLTGGYNVSTYLLRAYQDLGIGGTVLVTFTIAMCSAIVYGKCRKYGTNAVCAIGILGVFNACIFSMENSYLFSSSSPYIWIVISIIAGILCRSTKRHTVIKRVAHNEDS